MPDGDYKYSSWGGTNDVLVCSSQESEESSNKYNFADSDDNSSMNENVQENPYKYTSPDANSKIYVTNGYNQYVTKQWSQSQATERYNIQPPKTQNPRYNMPPAQTRMSEEAFSKKYKSDFETVLGVFDTATGVYGDTTTIVFGGGEAAKTILEPIKDNPSTVLLARIIQGVHSKIIGLQKILAEIYAQFTFRWASAEAFEKALKNSMEVQSKLVISEAEAGAAAKGVSAKLGYAALALLFLVVIYRGCMWGAAESQEEQDAWASKFRGAIYTFVSAVAVQAISKSHPYAVIVSVFIAIMDAIFMCYSDGDCDFGYAFDLGLQWWGDVISSGYKASVDYVAETLIPFYVELGHDVAEGVENAAETTSDYFTETVGPFWKEVGNDIADGVSNTWDKIVDQTKRSTESGNNDLPAWEVLGPSAGL